MMHFKSKRGFTLVEILLVLTLLVIMGALVVPNMRSSFLNQRLKKGADSIRAEWSRARVTAIKTGQTQVFRHLLSGNGYMTSPQFSPEDISETDDQTLFEEFDGKANLGVGGLGVTTEVERLPEDVYFLGADVSMDQRSVAKMVTYEQTTSIGFSASGEAREMSNEWGMPIFFFPDGTTSTARLVLANRNNLAITIELRGLTGISQVGSLRNSQEIAPLGAPR